MSSACSSGHGDIGNAANTIQEDLISDSFRWHGPFLYLEELKGDQDMHTIPTKYVEKLTMGRKPEQYLKRDGGSAVPLKPAFEFMLLKVATGVDRSHAFLLLSVKKKYGSTSLSNRVEAFYNGQIQQWQQWSIFTSRLSYMTSAQVRPYIYLGFQPFTAEELEFKRAVARACPIGQQQKRLRIACDPGDYLCKLGFHVLRVGHEQLDLGTYLKNKPLKWTLTGSGIFFFPLPQHYSTYENPSRAAEEDLKSLVLNFPSARICGSGGMENEPYSSGEYFVLADGINSFPALQKLLSDFAGIAEALEPKAIRVREEDLAVSFVSWGTRPFPIPVEDLDISESAASRSAATFRRLPEHEVRPAFLQLLDA